MNRVVKIFVIGVLLLGLLLFLGGMFFNSIVKTGIETIGPQLTGTSVTLDSVALSLLSGRGQINGLVLGNPKGFETEHALRIGTTRVVLDRNSVLTDHIIINEVFIDKPEFTFEGSLSGSNIKAIQENVEKAVESGQDAKDSESPSAKTYEIRNLIIKDGKVNVSLTVMQGKSATIPLPDIHLKDIGRESKQASFGDVLAEVFGAVSRAIFSAVSGAGDLLGEGLRSVGEAAKKVGEAAGEGATGLVEGVKNIFGK